MTKRATMLLASLFACLALVAGACSSDSDSAGSDGDDNAATNQTEVSAADKEAVATHYADGVYASYQASIASVTELQTALQAFVAAPSDATLQAAKDQWLTARDDYGPTEAFRFYDGPIDNPDDGPEGRINAWPMDEAYVDYVEGDAAAGIINNAAEFPEITEEVIVSANEDGGETNISTGWHAIEFLLWGQDLNADGPGTRPVTDYTTSPVAERRATYLTLLGDLLLADLTSVADQWDPEGDDNYRTEWLGDPDQAIADMFRGIGALTVGELAGERIAVAIETKDEEDEHSCFSDNTNADVHNNVLGTSWVYLGTYPGIDAGPGLDTLVEQVAPDTNDEIVAQIEELLTLTDGYAETFDKMIAGDSAPLEETVSGLEALGTSIAEGADALGIEVDTGV